MAPDHAFIVVFLAEVSSNPKDVIIELGGVNRQTPFHIARSDVPNLLTCEPTPARRERANGRLVMVKLQLIAEVGRDTIRVIEDSRGVTDFVFVGWGANLVRAIKDAIA